MLALTQRMMTQVARHLLGVPGPLMKGAWCERDLARQAPVLSTLTSFLQQLIRYPAAPGS